MTQKEYEDALAAIMAQEERLGVKIELHPIDKDHLDCIWYGGDVGTIQYKGYTFVISACGDIRLHGYIKKYGEVDIVDKNNSGRAYDELGRYLTDKDLTDLTDDEYLVYDNNNWFEVDLISPEGIFYDLFDCDNVLDDDLLDAFRDVEDYFEYIDVYESDRDAALRAADDRTIIRIGTDAHGQRTITYMGAIFWREVDNDDASESLLSASSWCRLSYTDFKVLLEDALLSGIEETEKACSWAYPREVKALTAEEAYKMYVNIPCRSIKSGDIAMDTPDGYYILEKI